MGRGLQESQDRWLRERAAAFKAATVGPQAQCCGIGYLKNCAVFHPVQPSRATLEGTGAGLLSPGSATCLRKAMLVSDAQSPHLWDCSQSSLCESK